MLLDGRRQFGYHFLRLRRRRLFEVVGARGDRLVHLLSRGRDVQGEWVG
jgi:hypothetical protein